MPRQPPRPVRSLTRLQPDAMARVQDRASLSVDDLRGCQWKRRLRICAVSTDWLRVPPAERCGVPSLTCDGVLLPSSTWVELHLRSGSTSFASLRSDSCQLR